MGIKRRGGYLFVSYIGDHAPSHVHVYKEGTLICKWDLEAWKTMSGGQPSRRLHKYLRELFGELK